MKPRKRPATALAIRGNEVPAMRIPTSAEDVAVLQREAEANAPAILSLQCETADDYELCDALLTECAQRNDAAVAMRKSATVPLYAVVRTIEGWFKPTCCTLEQCKRHLKNVMGAYRLRRAEAERAARLAAEEAATAGDSNALIASVTSAAELAEAPAGRASCGFAWKVKRIAEDMLPDEYWTPDVARLDALAKAHKGDEPPIVPGVIFERVANLGARR